MASVGSCSRRAAPIALGVARLSCSARGAGDRLATHALHRTGWRAPVDARLPERGLRLELCCATVDRPGWAGSMHALVPPGRSDMNMQPQSCSWSQACNRVASGQANGLMLRYIPAPPKPFWNARRMRPAGEVSQRLPVQGRGGRGFGRAIRQKHIEQGEALGSVPYILRNIPQFMHKVTPVDLQVQSRAPGPLCCDPN